jgi:hypothetical protein
MGMGIDIVTPLYGQRSWFVLGKEHGLRLKKF